MGLADRFLESRVVAEIRERTTLRLLQRMHRITHRMPVELQQVERARVLVVAPHMDDEVIGPGGTLALHRQVGSHVDVVFCAGAADADRERVRKAESAACAEFMGFSTPIHLDYPQGSLSLHESDLARSIADVVRTCNPDIVFCPFVTDHHRDHSAAAMATCEALMEVGFDGPVWAYEVWSSLWPNICVDISDVVETKRTAIALHESQNEGLDYVGGALGLNRNRGLRVEVDYAEAFFVSTAKKLTSIGREMNTV